MSRSDGVKVAMQILTQATKGGGGGPGSLPGEASPAAAQGALVHGQM